MKSGIFITFEGGDGVGKSTQVQRLSEHLIDAGQSTVITREPGGVPVAEEIRALILREGAEGVNDPMAEAILFYAARRLHLMQKIIPALNKGKVVLCDRFTDSTYVYQSVVKGVSEELLKMLDLHVVHQTQPHLTILLDMPANDAAQRRIKRIQTSDKFEVEGMEFHEKVRKGFLDRAKAYPERVHVVNAKCEPDEVADRIWIIVQNILKTKAEKA